MKELYINNKLCDLNEKDNPIALSYAVNNLGELQNRKASTTNRFTLPYTQHNLAICGLADDPGFTQLEPYRSLPAKIVQNGVEIVVGGIAFITETNKDGIQVQVISGVIDFFEVIDNRNINDLDLSEFDHTWDLLTVTNSQNNTEGFIYPIIDYGGLPIEADPPQVDARQLRPAVFAHTLLKMIIEEAGFTYEGSLFSDARFLSEIIPFSRDKFEHGAEYDASQFTAVVKNSSTQVLPEADRENLILFDDDFTGDPSGSWNTTTNEYTAQDILKVNINLEYDIVVRDIHRGGDAPSIFIRLQKWDGNSWATIAENRHYAFVQFQDIAYDDQVLEIPTELRIGEKIRVWSRKEPDVERIRGHFIGGATLKIETQKTDVVFGQNIQLSATLPEISQKNFIKDILQRYALTPVLDDYSRNIKFKSFKELYARKIEAADWTGKFINVQPEVEYKIGDYAQVNNGRYKSDENVPEDLGKGSILIDNTTLPREKDLLVSVYAASGSVYRLNGKQVSLIRKIENPAESTEFSIKTQPRILINQRIGNADIEFVAGGTPIRPIRVSVPYFIKSGLPGLSYQELMDEYYHELKFMLDRSRKEKREALIDELDINRLDFFRPIYDGRTAQYYYLNAVEDYIEGEPATVELIRM